MTTPIPTLELFAGIGGIARGLESAGFKTAAFSEFDPKLKPEKQYAAQVFRKHWPDVQNLGDITTIAWDKPNADELALGATVACDFDYYELGSTGRMRIGFDRIEVIAGGFPCQDISLAGKGAGIEDGTRSGLWKQYADAIRAIRPRGVLIENVAALAGRGLDRVLTDLAHMGYDAEWDVLGAAAVGAPHLRERMFILAWPHGTAAHAPWPEPQPVDHWAAEPLDVPRLSEKTEQRVAKLRCLGNAVVPALAAHIGSILRERIEGGLQVHDHSSDVRTKVKGGARGETRAWFGWVGDSTDLAVADGKAQPMPTIAGAKLPRAGRMTRGVVYERSRSFTQAQSKARGLAMMAPTLRRRPVIAGQFPDLVPTPNAHASNLGEGADTWLERRETMVAKGYNGNGAGVPLSVFTQMLPEGEVTDDERLVPTPTAKDGDSVRAKTAIRETPPARASQPGETLLDYADPTNGGRLVPTPTAADGIRQTEHHQRGNETLLGAARDVEGGERLIPTPRPCTGVRSSGMNRTEIVDALEESAGYMVPTPTSRDWKGGNEPDRRPEGRDTLPDRIRRMDEESLLPTPTAADGPKLMDRNYGKNLTLQGRAKELGGALIPTPTTSDANGSTQGPNVQGGQALRNVVEDLPGGGLVPTPRAAEWKGTGPLGSKSHDYRLDKGYLDATVQHVEQRSGRLFPPWVCWLMDFPTDWVDL